MGFVAIGPASAVLSQVGGPAPGGGGPSSLSAFHPAVAAWFGQRFPDGPTEPQERAWPQVRAGADVLLAAPTGSGKTLAAFLVAIDQAYRAAEAGDAPPGTQVVYISPLKALAVDVRQNLEVPLAEMAVLARRLGHTVPDLTIGVRTGDTPASARAAMVRRPPTILVTTPESFSLMLTAERSRATLRQVQTVVVDEIHAMARDKRGAHLALSLERLQHIQTGGRPQRIGLSATQRPIERVAALLTGRSEAARGTSIVDCGTRRHLRLAVETPGSELQAVVSTEQFGEVVDRIARHVGRHRTTLVFVNTRRMAERLACLLSERLGADDVAAHHGSMSAARRLDVEQRLRSGALRALVATASLELGIDVGPVDLVCQLGSPRLVSTFVQRVGRANHQRDGVPEGIVFPLSRDDLVECVALVGAALAGRLDVLEPPVAPLDILVQQVVAEVAAAGEWSEDGLYDLVRRAAPFAGLARATFDEAIELASEGIPTGHGRRLAYLHRDRVHGMLRPRRGARLAALTSGGAIPDVGDYRVVLDPDDVVVGTVNEDFAVESMVGDVFVLGTHSWRVRRVEAGVMRVVDAEGAAPTIPFWFGEAPSRSAQLSDEVSRLRRAVGAAADRAEAVDEVCESCHVDAAVAEQAVDYLRAGMAQLGVMPSGEDVVFERFFDDAGGMQLVVHAPFGGRVNRAFGLALRKRFCATFDFELQAAAGDDALVLSLGVHHAFPLGDAPRLLRAATAPDVLAQAVLTSPIFPARWRFALTCSLAVLRNRGGRRTPLPIQRMEADDLLAAVFPALAACQENTAAGPVVVPDHILVRQAIDDCLHQAMDVDGLVEVLAAIEDGRIRTHLVDGTEPSVFAHEILDGKPFTFLDDAPLEERRTRAVPLRRGLPGEPGPVNRIDHDAIDEVVAEQARLPRDREELHDLLLRTVLHPPIGDCQAAFDALVVAGRAVACDPGGGVGLRWVATERQPWVEAALPDATLRPLPLPLGPTASAIPGPPDADAAAADIVQGHLERSGPTTVAALAAATGLPATRVSVGLGRIEAAGGVLRGRFDDRIADPDQWCARPMLARLHARARRRLRAGVQPVTAQDLVRFLLHWHHVAPGTLRTGHGGVLAVVAQLQGFEAAAGSWEDDVLRARVEAYRPEWLDDLCQSGRVAWGRLGLRPPEIADQPRRGAATPSRATPIALALRPDLPWLLAAARGGEQPDEPGHGAAHELVAVLRAEGACFHGDLVGRTRRLPADVEAGLWDLVARGIVTADGFRSVRSLLDRRDRGGRRRSVGGGHSRAARSEDLRHGGDGRWSLLPTPAEMVVDDLAALVARQLVARWGVVLWDVVVRETLAVPWRHVLRALRRLADRGDVHDGRFVTGFSGEQFADPAAVPELRRIRDLPRTGQVVRLSAADPLNVAGVLLPGPRIPAVRTRYITIRDGEVIEAC